MRKSQRKIISDDTPERITKLPFDYPFPVHLSTAGDSKNRFRPLVNFQPVRVVNFRPAPTVLPKLRVLIHPIYVRLNIVSPLVAGIETASELKLLTKE